MTKAIVIGLTGNIGTGKSVVLNMLKQRGAHVIDADHVAHRVMAAGGSAYPLILAAFGRDILRADGSIERSKLGQIVFNHPDQLARLERIIHPAVAEAIQAEIQQTTAPVVVIEAIKLLEAGLSVTFCDQVWVVTAAIEQQIERLMANRSMSQDAAAARMATQSPQAFKASQADVVIENNGTLAELEAKVEAAWNSLFVREG